jgi:hypothetical protein
MALMTWTKSDIVNRLQMIIVEADEIFLSYATEVNDPDKEERAKKVIDKMVQLRDDIEKDIYA